MKVFAPFRLDTQNQCLWRADERMALTPKAFDVLRFLVENAGRLVTHDQILEALWSDTYVNPEGIRKYVLEIRKVLGDSSEQPRFIQTLPKRGYQFIAKVSSEAPSRQSREAIAPSQNIVGRDAAFAQLDSLLESAVQGRRQVVFITGEAGIGKTTLVDAFQQQASRIPNLRLARGQCIEGFGDKDAYYPILEAVGSLLRGAPDDSLVQTLEKQAPTWFAQFPFAVKPEQREWLRQEILGSTQGRMVREICEALEVMTAQAPLLLILEDLHWTDSSTLDLISVLARRRVPAKLLLIATYRPLDVVLSQIPLKPLKQDLSIRNLCHEIAIERLEESEVAEYLAKVFADSDLPAALAQAIYRHSDGNPLFMAGIVRDMAKRGLIARVRGIWALTAPVEDVYQEIPETLQQMVDIQFERLSEEEKRVLQCSSVAGERFPVWAPAVMLGSSVQLSEEICERLGGREQFLRFVGMQQAADGIESPHYEFRHALYRQALYRGLSESSRIGFHLRLARHLLTFYTAGKRELASEVALHLEKGRDCEQALHCLIVAAENASRRLALPDAIKILRRALELLPSIRGDARVHLEYQALRRIGDFHYAFGAMSDSVAAYEAAAARAKEAGLDEEYVTALTAKAFPGFFIDPVKGQQICNLAMQASRNLSNPIVRAKTELAVACFRLLYDSWTADDVEICEQARKTLNARPDSIPPPHVHDIYVRVLQGDYAIAAEQAGILIDTAEEPARTLAWGGKGFVYMTVGNFGGMLDLVRKGRESAAKNESPGWMWILGDSWIRQLSFDLEGARNLENITFPSDAEPHALWLKMVAGVCTGYLESAANNHETALAAFGAVRDFERTPNSFIHWNWRMQAHLGTIEAYLHAGDLPNANREAASFLESANATSDPKLRALAWEINARVAAADGNWPKAQEYIQKALAIVDKYEILPTGWQVHRTAWKICQVLGDTATAARHRACARQMIMTIANSFELDEPLRECFLRAPAISRVMDLAASS